MHTEIFNNIDTLINMANSSLELDEIKLELASLKKQIKAKENSIEDLRSLMTESRYFNASNELVDKNIEISLKNKISRLTRKNKDLKNELEITKQNEEKMHNEITSLKAKLEKNESYLKTLKTKSENATNNKYYQELYEKETTNDNLLAKELEKKQEAYQEIMNELEGQNKELQELNAKLENEKKHLADILDNLNNPSAYLDEDLKATDEEKLVTLTKDLEKLEKRRADLLTDAKIVGADAKELIIENDIYEAINKIKELVNIVKKKPYMDINSASILEEELEKKESLRVELSTLIDNKNYEDLNTDAISARIDYIKEETTNHQKEIERYQKEITEIDTFVNTKLGDLITKIENEIIKIEESISEYHTILKDKNKSNRSKLNLEGTITKKEKEREILNEILASYKEDLTSKINRTNILNEMILELQTEIDKYSEEINNLEKKAMLDFKTKDYREEENDKEKLKQINEEIKEIKNRQKFDKTPDEIFDQIDMLLDSIKPKQAFEENSKKEPQEERNSNIDNLFEMPAVANNQISPEKEAQPKENAEIIAPEILSENKKADTASEKNNSSVSPIINPIEKMEMLEFNEPKQGDYLKVIEMIPVGTANIETNSGGI